MAKPKRQSLKIKLVFFATLLVVFVASSFGFFIIRGQKKAITKTQEDNQSETVKALAQVAREAILVNDDTDMVNYVNLLKRSLTTAYAMVLNPDGTVIVHTDPLLLRERLTDSPTQKALSHRQRGTPLVQNLRLKDGREVIDLSIPIMIGLGSPKYNGTARIGFDKEAISKIIAVSIREETRRIKGAFAVALLIGLIGSFILATFITRPLSILKKGSRVIGQGKLDHRITVNSNDELGDLADEFNLMAKKLGELDEMKRDFVSNVTHELRSPMTSIRGYMDLLLQGATGPLTDIQKDYLSVIKNNAVRLGRFIDNLLDVSKIEAKKLKLTPEVQDMTSLAHEMEVLFKPQATEKKITLKSEVSSTLTKGYVDKDKIAEVFINLTSNAVKFTPPGGEILIRAKEGSNYLEFSIEDNGLGIPADKVTKLFNKFEQIQAKKGKGSANNQKGTGLGLAIVKGIIEAHGGKIWAKSPGPSGKGTAFFFTVPKMTDELKSRLG